MHYPKEKSMNKVFLWLLMSLYASASVSISTLKPISKETPLTLSLNAMVLADNPSIISSESIGIIRTFISLNGFVKKGQKIAQIIDSPRQAKLPLLRRQIHLLDLQEERQRKKIKISQNKFKAGLGSKESSLSQKIILDDLQSKLDSSKNTLKILELEEKNSLILAKEEGFISQIVANNSYITYGQKIATLSQNKQSIKVFIPSIYAKNIHENMPITIKSMYQNSQAKIENILYESTHNFIEMIVKSPVMYPLNLQVKAEIRLLLQNMLSIPKKSVVLVNNLPAIFIIKKHKAILHFITIIKDTSTQVLIKNTLNPNDEIALDNAYLLSDGLEVDRPQ